MNIAPEMGTMLTFLKEWNFLKTFKFWFPGGIVGGSRCEHCPRDGGEDHDLRVKRHLGGDNKLNKTKKVIKPNEPNKLN